MKFLVTMLIALILTPIAIAAPPVASGTLILETPGPYAFADQINFTATTDNLKGNQYPLVYVECYSVVDNELLYGQLDHPNVAFVLGASSSEWHTDRDDANCTASLRVYGGKKDQGQVILDSLTFSASG